MHNIFHCSFPLSRVYSHRIIAEAEYIAEYISISIGQRLGSWTTPPIQFKTSTLLQMSVRVCFVLCR